MDGLAQGTDGALSRVAIVWNPVDCRTAAGFAVLDRCSQHQTRVSCWLDHRQRDRAQSIDLGEQVVASDNRGNACWCAAVDQIAGL